MNLGGIGDKHLSFLLSDPLGSLPVRPQKKLPAQGGEFFYGGHYRDRTCDPYRVNGVMCLFIKHYFLLLVADKWLISAKNLYNLFLRS